MKDKTLLAELVGRHLLWNHENNGCFSSHGTIVNVPMGYFLVEMVDGVLKMISFDEPHVIIEHEPFVRESDAGYPLFYVVDPDAEPETNNDEEEDDEDNEEPVGPDAREFALAIFSLYRMNQEACSVLEIAQFLKRSPTATDKRALRLFNIINSDKPVLSRELRGKKYYYSPVNTFRLSHWIRTN